MSPNLTIPHLPGQGAFREFSLPSSSHLPVHLLSAHLTQRFHCDGDWEEQARPVASRRLHSKRDPSGCMPAGERACLLCLSVFFSKTHILSEMWRAEIETRPHMKLSPVPGSSSPALPPSYLQCVMRLAGSPNSLVAKLFLSVKYETSPQHMNETQFTSLHTFL